MTAEVRRQMTQTWRIFEAIVGSFDEESWLSAGCGYVNPARVAIHTLLGIEYYSESPTEWSERYKEVLDGITPENPPGPEQVIGHARELRPRVDRWLTELDPDEEDTQFGWAGPTRAGVVEFLMRHTLFHIGELNALLYLCRNGAVEDKWMAGFDESAG